MANGGNAGSPASIGRTSRSAGTVNASQAVTARSIRTVAVVASMLPFSNTVGDHRHGQGFLRWALPAFASTQTSRSTQRHAPFDGPNGSSITAGSIFPFCQRPRQIR